MLNACEFSGHLLLISKSYRDKEFICNSPETKRQRYGACHYFRESLFRSIEGDRRQRILLYVQTFTEI